MRPPARPRPRLPPTTRAAAGACCPLRSAGKGRGWCGRALRIRRKVCTAGTEEMRLQGPGRNRRTPALRGARRWRFRRPSALSGGTHYAAALLARKPAPKPIIARGFGVRHRSVKAGGQVALSGPTLADTFRVPFSLSKQALGLDCPSPSAHVSHQLPKISPSR